MTLLVRRYPYDFSSRRGAGFIHACTCCQRNPYAGKPRNLVRKLKRVDGWRHDGRVCLDCKIRIERRGPAPTDPIR